jgi:hypothetical protein
MLSNPMTDPNGAAIYGNIYHQYTPFMIAYIYTSTMDPSWEMEHSAIRKMTSRKNPWIPPFSSTGDPLNEGQHPHDVFYRKWLPKSISNIDQDVSLNLGLPQSFGIRNAPTWPFVLEK